jgi:hypothetical protein
MTSATRRREFDVGRRMRCKRAPWVWACPYARRRTSSVYSCLFCECRPARGSAFRYQVRQIPKTYAKTYAEAVNVDGCGRETKAHRIAETSRPGRHLRENPVANQRDARCGCSSMAERQLPKLHTRVRFPSPAPHHPLRVMCPRLRTRPPAHRAVHRSRPRSHRPCRRSAAR